MRIMLLAALAIAAPAIAQTTPAPPPADPAMQAPGTTGDTMTTTDTTTADTTTPTTPTTPMTSTEAESPMGGYGPASTAATPVPAGATVVYRQAPDVATAYPAPAPLAKYPPCKKGQYDNCIDRNSRK